MRAPDENLRAIGGDIAILPQEFGQANPERAWPSFGKPFQLRCDTGRSALKVALRDWLSRRQPAAAVRVWVPSYICPSVTSAIAQLGLTSCLYPDRPGQTEWREPPRPARNDLVIVVHYFGLLNRPALEWLDAHQSRDWGVLEDCVQAPYTKEAGERGEYAIASLRKWWSAPDGAVLSADEPLRAPALLPPNEAFVTKRMAAKLLRATDSAEAAYLRWTSESEELLEQDEPRAASWVATQLLQAADPAAAAGARRANWLQLERGLQSHPSLRPVFDQVGSTETPLAYPVLVAQSERDRLRRFLQDSRIYCAVHWPLGDDCPGADLDLSRGMLSIPLDQRYAPSHMDFVVSRINTFFRTGAP